MPTDLHWNTKKFVRAYNKSVEEEVNFFFKREHQIVVENYKLLKKYQKKIKNRQKQLAKIVSKYEKGKVSADEMNAEKNKLLQELQLFEIFGTFLKSSIMKIYEPLNINHNLDNILISPNGDTSFDFTFEAFLRPKPNTKVVIPIGKGFFKLTESSIVYICFNTNHQDKSKNVFSLRFLKANKKLPYQFKEYLARPYTLLTKFTGFLIPAKVKIDPANFRLKRPPSDSSDKETDFFEGLGPISGFGKVMRKIGGSVDTALEDPLNDFLGKGASSLIVKGKDLCIQAGIKTAFGLVKVKNLFEHCEELIDEKTGEPLLDSFTYNSFDDFNDGTDSNERSYADFYSK